MALRDDHGQFEVALADVELLRVVGRVARLVCPEAPATLSQPAFDRYVADHRDQFDGVPTGRAIYMRVNSGSQGRVPWRQIVAGGLRGDASARQTVVSGTRSTSEIPIDDHVVAVAMRIVAKGLAARDGGVLREARYDSIRAKLIGAGRGRNIALERILPTAAQISQKAGSWDAAQEVAGLHVESPAGGERDGDAPALPQQHATRRQMGMPVLDALTLFVDTNGWMPSQTVLEQFTREAGLALQKRHPTPWAIWTQRFVERRRAAGREPPPRPPLRGRPPLIIPDQVPAEFVPRGHWADLDRCAWKVVEYWDDLPRRQYPSQRPYGQWAVGKPAPAPGTFEQHGGWNAVLDRARELRERRDEGGLDDDAG